MTKIIRQLAKNMQTLQYLTHMNADIEMTSHEMDCNVAKYLKLWLQRTLGNAVESLSLCRCGLICIDCNHVKKSAKDLLF